MRTHSLGVKFGLEESDNAPVGARAPGTTTVIMPNSKTFVGGSLDEIEEEEINEKGSVTAAARRTPSSNMNQRLPPRSNDGLNRNERRLKNKVKGVDPSK